MKQHEREFFISLIRSGNIYVKKDNIRLTIKPLTIHQSFESCEVYNESQHQAYLEDIMSEENMLLWMKDQDLWTNQDEDKAETIKKDIEKLKVQIYNSRNDKKLKEKIRLYIRTAEKHLLLHNSKKNSYMQNTTEGIATSEKISWIIKNTTYYNNDLYDFSDISLSYVIDEWQLSFLSDSISRDLARNEPWKSLWTIKSNSQNKLFANGGDSELTYNQKNLLIWSQMYDNIQESLDCPSKEVIEDDDMLDGWFIIQNQKREKESAEKEVESLTKNQKINNSSEVFVVAQSEEHANSINKANNLHANAVKKQRSSFIEKFGQVNDHDLPDKKLEIFTQQTNMMRGKIKGGR